MKIIKKGKIKKKENKFTCPNCECVFLADETEFEKMITEKEEIINICCPFCKVKFEDRKDIVVDE